MALAIISSNTNRSAFALMDAADEFSGWVYAPPAHLVDISLVDSTFTGTVKVQRRQTSAVNEFVTDKDGVDLEFTGDATFTLQSGPGYHYRLYMVTRSAGSIAGTIRVGARE